MTEQPGSEKTGTDHLDGADGQEAAQQPSEQISVQVSGQPGSRHDAGPIQWRSAGPETGEQAEKGESPTGFARDVNVQRPENAGTDAVPPRSPQFDQVPQRPVAQPQQPGPQMNQSQYQGGQQLPEYWTQYYQHQKSANQFQTDPDYLRLKTVRTQITVANICGPVSLLIGGIALSTVGIVSAILAWRGAKRVVESNSPSAPMANNFRKSALVSIVICCAALVINAFYAAMVMPSLIDAVNTGDYSGLFGDAPSSDAGTSGSSGSADGGSAWG